MPQGRSPQQETRLVVATGNLHKIAEIRAILQAFPCELLDLGQFPPCSEPDELAPDYKGNALLKARYYSAVTQLPTLADDSGLEVDALDRRPGVLSARYGGQQLASQCKIEMLLAELRQFPGLSRSARLRCAVALVWPDGDFRCAEATCEGSVLESPCDSDGGFGYDPIFVPTGFSQSFSQLAPLTKNRVSHRGQALRKLFELG